MLPRPQGLLYVHLIPRLDPNLKKEGTVLFSGSSGQAWEQVWAPPLMDSPGSRVCSCCLCCSVHCG